MQRARLNDLIFLPNFFYNALKKDKGRYDLEVVPARSK